MCTSYFIPFYPLAPGSPAGGRTSWEGPGPGQRIVRFISSPKVLSPSLAHPSTPTPAGPYRTSKLRRLPAGPETSAPSRPSCAMVVREVQGRWSGETMGIRIGGGGTGRGLQQPLHPAARTAEMEIAAGAGRSGGGGGSEETRRRGGAGARKLGRGGDGRSCWEGSLWGGVAGGGGGSWGKKRGSGGRVYGGGSPEHRRVSGRLSDRCCGAWWGPPILALC